jgi:hypothetical protein
VDTSRSVAACSRLRNRVRSWNAWGAIGGKIDGDDRSRVCFRIGDAPAADAKRRLSICAAGGAPAADAKRRSSIWRAMKKRYVVPRRTEGGQGRASGVAESYSTQVMSGRTE